MKKDCIQNIGRGVYLPVSKVEDHRLTVLTEALVKMYLQGADNDKEVPDVDGCLLLGKGQVEGKDPAVNPRSFGFYVGSKSLFSPFGRQDCVLDPVELTGAFLLDIIAGCNCYDGPQYRGPPRTLENP